MDKLSYIVKFLKSHLKKIIIISSIGVLLVGILGAFLLDLDVEEGIYKAGDESNVPYSVSEYIKTAKIGDTGIEFDMTVQELWDKLIKSGSKVASYLSGPEALEKLINAEIVTQYPKFGKGGLDGIIEIKRADTNSNTNTLRYVDESIFTSYIDEDNEEAFKCYTISGDQILMAQSIRETTTETTTVEGEEPTTRTIVTYDITSTSINYKSVIQKYTMPFNYLWAFLVISDCQDLVIELADYVIQQSKIVITGFEKEEVVIGEAYPLESTKSVTVTVTDPDTGETSTETQEKKMTVTTKTDIESNIIDAQLTKADTWIVDYEKDAELNIKDDPNSEEDNFVTILNRYYNARSNIIECANSLFEILESNDDTANMVDLTKYLLNSALGSKKFDDNDFKFDEYENNVFVDSTSFGGGGILVNFLASWESGAVWEYINGNGTYNNYISKYVTQDKKQYICYSDGQGTPDRNFGYGLCHTANAGSTYMHESEYKQNGIEISSGQYNAVGVSKIDVSIVDGVMQILLNNIKTSIKNDLSRSGINDLSENQLNALAAVKYQYGNIGNFAEMYKKYGDTEELKNNVRANGARNAYYFIEVKPGGDNAKKRGAANWKAFHEGIYTTQSGKTLDPDSYSANGDFLGVAKKVWTTVCTSGKYTRYGGSSIPVNGPNIDCSSFVSWCLYEYGYKEFGGWQKTSQIFYTTNWNSKYGWTEISIGSGQNPSNQLQPGDIFVRHGNGTHHVTVVAEIKDGRLYSYDCGNTHANWNGTSGAAVDKTYFLTATGSGKIIRVTPPK